jgi:AAA family ATP:ADP antiporter
VVLIAIGAIAALVARTADDKPAPAEAKRDASLADAIAGARLVVGSRYLTCIAFVVIGYEIVSNVIDYQFNTFIADRYTSEAATASFLGKFNTASIAASAGVQLLVTTWILRFLGPGFGLLVLPAVLGAGSAAFVAVPVFAVIASTFFADAALGYSLNQASKEVLYTPTDQATKYQAKAFIDIFLMRFGKAVSSFLILAWAAWFLPHGVQQLSLLSLAAVAAWFFFARAAGREFRRQASDDAPPSSSRRSVGYRTELKHA